MLRASETSLENPRRMDPKRFAQIDPNTCFMGNALRQCSDYRNARGMAAKHASEVRLINRRLLTCHGRLSACHAQSPATIEGVL